MNITITCKQCSKKFEHGTMGDDMRGKRTKKLCYECKVEKKRIESKLYQRDLRLSKPSRPKRITQSMIIKDKLLGYMHQQYFYNHVKQYIIDTTTKELQVPKPTVRRCFAEIQRYK